MIYFIHGFEWPYEKENTVRINEYNQPSLKINGELPEKEIIFPVWENLDSFINECYRNENDTQFIQIDKLIYKYKPSESDIVWNYGFVFAETDDNSIWENLSFTINKIIEADSNIWNINIPFSLFKTIIQKYDFTIFLINLYDVLIKKDKLNFFIYLENNTEIKNFYNNFESKDNNIDFSNSESQIISCLKFLKNDNEIRNKYACFLKGNDSEWLKYEEQPYLFYTYNKKFNDEVEEILKHKDEIKEKIKQKVDEYYLNRTNKNKRLSNYSRDIWSKVTDYPEWIFSDYIPYKIVFKYSTLLCRDKSAQKNFFGLFGYLPAPSDSFTSHIPSSIPTFLRGIPREKKESEKELEDMSRIWGENLFSEKYTQVNRTNLQKYAINRRDLFFLVFEYNLDNDQAEKLFELSYCQLHDSELIEDKLLLSVLKYWTDYNSSPKFRFDLFYNQLMKIR